jgi:hypothetical protein
MKSLRIKTKLFPTEPEGNLETCNGCPGSALADWLKTMLSQRQYECDNIIQEDYGWGFWINVQPVTIWICVGTDVLDEDSEIPEWEIFIKHEVSPFNPSQWFKGKQGLEAEVRIFADVKAAVESESRIHILEDE